MCIESSIFSTFRAILCHYSLGEYIMKLVLKLSCSRRRESILNIYAFLWNLVTFTLTFVPH